MAISLARRTLSKVTNSPVSRITFKCALPHASFTFVISSETYWYSPHKNLPREITISISSAPAFTTDFTSANLALSEVIPLGKAVATDAIFIFVPDKAFFAMGTIFGYTQIAATFGNPGYWS